MFTNLPVGVVSLVRILKKSQNVQTLRTSQASKHVYEIISEIVVNMEYKVELPTDTGTDTLTSHSDYD